MKQELLKIDKINISFPEKTVFKDFSFSLAKGEKILITGPNGCGKTTLVKCILGLIKPDSGTVEKNTDNIAYCKQDHQAPNFPISAREIVKMGIKKGTKNSKDSVQRAMKLTNTENLSDRKYFTLSGGERQRISLARCICQNSDLLLLDEPSSFLDTDSKAILIETLKNIPKQVSAIVVTHDSELSETLGWRTVELGVKGEGTRWTE